MSISLLPKAILPVCHYPLPSRSEGVLLQNPSGKSDALFITFVEVVGFTYNTLQKNPSEVIWDPADIADWSEVGAASVGQDLFKYPSSQDR